jgi:hypothetical protein
MERGRKHKAFIVFICCLFNEAVNRSDHLDLEPIDGMISEIRFEYDLGHAVAQLVEALRYKPERRGFDSR